MAVRPKKPIPLPKTFTLDWYKELGWSQNPFTTENLEPIDHFITGCEAEQQRLNYFIIEGFQYGTITGGSGQGKSVLLSWLAYELSKYRNRYRVVRIDCKKIKDKEFVKLLTDGILGIHEKALIHGYYKSGIEKLFARIAVRIKKDYTPDDTLYKRIATGNYEDIKSIEKFVRDKLSQKPLILLLDDAGGISVWISGFLHELYDEELPLRVIAAGTLDQLKKSELESLHQKDQLHIELKSIAYPAVRELIKRRIEFFGGSDIEPFHDVELSDLWEESGKNVEKMLELCNDHAVKVALRRLKEKPRDPIGIHKPKKEAVEPIIIKHTHTGDFIEKDKPDAGSEYKINVIDRSQEPFDCKVVQHETADYKVKEAKKKTPRVTTKS